MGHSRHANHKPDFALEKSLGGRIAGIDEAGRGPWAGPVVAAAVVLPSDGLPKALTGLNDSKKLSRQKRESLFPEILIYADVGVGQASVDEIDSLNILQATFLAMRRALSDLTVPVDRCLIDGNRDPGLDVQAHLVVRGDSKSLSIAAASIIAKVTRDRIMAVLADEYPTYGWEKNAGYGVPHHKESLRLVGPSRHHRRSFAPVRESLRENSLIDH